MLQAVSVVALDALRAARSLGRSKSESHSQNHTMHCHPHAQSKVLHGVAVAQNKTSPHLLLGALTAS